MKLKRAIPVALLFALVLAVPAISQGDEELDVPGRVEILEKKIEQQSASIKAMQEQLAVQAGRNAELARALNVAEKKGFLYPGANSDAKAALLKGLRALVGAKKSKAIAADDK